MSGGYAWALAALQDDLEFEQAAVKLYGKYGAAVKDPALKEVFKDLARAEAGHVRGLRKLIEDFGRDDQTVVFFCPMCGWEIDYGSRPSEGTELKCPMCAGRFALRLVGGDWTLERVGPPKPSR
jgi:rubrerythrin